MRMLNCDVCGIGQGEALAPLALQVCHVCGGPTHLVAAPEDSSIHLAAIRLYANDARQVRERLVELGLTGEHEVVAYVPLLHQGWECDDAVALVRPAGEGGVRAVPLNATAGAPAAFEALTGRLSAYREATRLTEAAITLLSPPQSAGAAGATYHGYGAPFSTAATPPSLYAAAVPLKEFVAHLDGIVQEVGLKADGSIASHTLQGTIDLRCLNEEGDDIWYRLVGIDTDRLMGCGCWRGATLEIEKFRD